MKARIVYASMTGNDADMADILEEDLQDYGEGKMTDDVADFYEQLKELDLSGKYFAVMGSGDMVYADHFCENVFDFEKMFNQVGAKEVTKPVTIENAPDDDDIAAIDNAAKEMADQLNG